MKKLLFVAVLLTASFVNQVNASFAIARTVTNLTPAQFVQQETNMVQGILDAVNAASAINMEGGLNGLVAYIQKYNGYGSFSNIIAALQKQLNILAAQNTAGN